MNKNLVELKDFLIPPFYITLTKEYRESLVKKALSKEKNLNILAKNVGCHSDTLKNFKNYQKVSLNAKLLINLLNFIEIPLSQVEEHVVYIKRGCSNREVQIKLPIRVTPELSLLLAKACGDGGVLSDWRFHYTNNQLNLIEEVINAVNSSIGRTRHTLHKRARPGTVYEIKFSPVIGYILNLLGAPKGPKINQDFCMPSWIVNGNVEVKSSFIRGLFDDESTVNKHKTTRRIVISMGKCNDNEESLRTFLGQVKTILRELNIKTSEPRIQMKYDQKVMLAFGIYGKTNFENYEKCVGFSHNQKKVTLRDMIDSYKKRTEEII